jgi:biopolymer transport protein ExbD
MADDMRIEPTSMTDIIFLLLIVFMISTTFEPTSRCLDVQLPESTTADAIQEVQQHIIEIGLEDTLRLDGQAVLWQDLPPRLRPDRAQAQRRSAVIRADKRLPYGRVVSVLDLVRQANIRDIAVAVR